MAQKPRKDIGQIRWSENCRAILMQLWISSEPVHLVSRIVTALDMPEPVVKYHLRLLKSHGYVDRQEGGKRPLPRFRGDPNGGGMGFISAADLWWITEEGKAKAEELAAEREERDGKTDAGAGQGDRLGLSPGAPGEQRA